MCTREACAFRDRVPSFGDAAVFGISSDSMASHAAFAAKYGLPYPLLSDPGGKVRKLYGAASFLGLIPGRVTVVIDAGGTVRGVYRSALDAEKHVEEALRVLSSLT